MSAICEAQPIRRVRNNAMRHDCRGKVAVGKRRGKAPSSDAAGRYPESDASGTNRESSPSAATPMDFHTTTRTEALVRTLRLIDRKSPSWSSIPEWIRTTNLRLRRPTLYPVELRGRRWHQVSAWTGRLQVGAAGAHLRRVTRGVMGQVRRPSISSWRQAAVLDVDEEPGGGS